jgi:hypothetical protein
MQKRIKDGKVGVLVSPGFGAGWSTWNPEWPAMLFDPVIVDWVDSGLNSDKLGEAKLRYPDACWLGFDQLCVVWVPVGQKFMITEYDGSETIVCPEDYDWVTA